MSLLLTLNRFCPFCGASIPDFEQVTSSGRLLKWNTQECNVSFTVLMLSGCSMLNSPFDGS